MSDPSITYFPVGNGDTTLVRLSDETSIIIDCNITKDSEDEDDEKRYDVHSHLLKMLNLTMLDFMSHDFCVHFYSEP